MSTVVTMTAQPGGEALLSAVGIRIGHFGHAVVPLSLGALPAGALLAGDRAAPDVARAVAAVAAADGIAVLWPMSDSGSALLESFLDLLPADAVAVQAVLPFGTGTGAGAVGDGSALDHAARPLLSRVFPGPVLPGCFVPDADIRTYPGGGVVLAAASALPVAEATDSFLGVLAQQSPAAALPRATGRVSPAAGAPDLTVVRAGVDDPVLAPLLRDLMIEYSTRYGGPSPYTTLTEVPAADFAAPDGTFLALTQHGELIAGGALRRYDEQTAEVKRVWTSSRHRRRGLARRLMAELEQAALDLGYRRIHLMTGGRQPEAVALYLATGYLPRFDPAAQIGDRGPLAFGKELVAGAGLVEWENPPTPESDLEQVRRPAVASVD